MPTPCVSSSMHVLLMLPLSSPIQSCCLLQVDPGVAVWVAKVDLDNFYHRLLLPEWMQPYFGLPPVLASDIGVDGEGLVYPCCKTLPMGWSHSVFVAQACHEYLLDTRTRLRPEDRVTVAGDLRLDRTRHQAYIDDLILLGPDRDQVDELQQHYMGVVGGVGLPAKMSKVVRPRCDGVECLGLEVDGVRH